MADQELIDLAPSATRLARLLPGVADDQLSGPTPCAGRTVGQLLQHIVGLTAAFKAAAEKDLGPWTDTNPDANGWPDLEEGWRETLRGRLPALVAAWSSPAAWEGMTRAGGIDLPGQIAGLVALGEITLHGWDLARSTGQDYDSDEATATAVEGFVQGFDAKGTPGLFGPAVDAPADAGAFGRALARSGRDPRWVPTR
jgi:uncharacterized protein (TIGR03086 family)